MLVNIHDVSNQTCTDYLEKKETNCEKSFQYNTYILQMNSVIETFSCVYLESRIINTESKYF